MAYQVPNVGEILKKKGYPMSDAPPPDQQFDGWQGWAQRNERLRKFDGMDRASLEYDVGPTALGFSLARGSTFEPGTPQLDAGMVAAMPQHFRQELAGDIAANAQGTLANRDKVDPGAARDAEALSTPEGAMGMLTGDRNVRLMQAFGPDPWRRQQPPSYADLFSQFNLGR